MAKNWNLAQAKSAKNDEFYTQYSDIQTEVNAYLEYDENVFRGKTVLLPCDDPEWSNFTKFFAQNFERFGLKKLISTSYAAESKRIKAWEPTLFETENPHYNAGKSRTNGKLFILDRDRDGDNRIDVNDLDWDYLEDDGDFRSEEVRALRDEADFIITNPPFSLFREFLAWIIDGGKRFTIIGNKNAITYKEVFPLIKENQIWTGAHPMGEDMLFDVPKAFAEELLKTEKCGSSYRIIDGKVKGRSAGIWFTNIEHGRRHQRLELMTMAENLRFTRHQVVKERGYQKYDNYDAIEVPFTDAIPADYDGVMGVPISFLDKYCPEQFEILGTDITDADVLGIRPIGREWVKHYRAGGGTGHLSPAMKSLVLRDKKEARTCYKRILIKKKQEEQP